MPLENSSYRVLYVQPYNWDGGPHQSLRTLVANLDRARFLPIVILPGPSPVAEEFARLGVEVRFDPGVCIVPRSLSPIRQLGFWITTRTSARRLAAIIKREDVCLIHVNCESCWVGGVASKITGVPAISHLRGLSVLSPSWLGRLTTWILNNFNRALIATSNTVKQAYVARGARPELIHVIYNGVNAAAFDPQHIRPTLRSELGIEDGQPLVGMIANLDPRKGHHDFVAACALVRERIPHAEFVIVGDTHLANDRDYYHHLRELIDGYGLTASLRFLGPRRDIPNVLKSLDVVVQPSLSEAGPRVPLEAMAMECSIVVTDAGGNSEEVVNGQTGLVVPVSDVHALANAVLNLLSDRMLARRIGKAGRQRVLGMFTQETHVLQIQQLYNQLLLTQHHPLTKGG